MPESDSTILCIVGLEVCENKQVYSMCHDMKVCSWQNRILSTKKHICRKANIRFKLET